MTLRGSDFHFQIERLLGARAGDEVVVPVDLIITDDWTTPALLAPLRQLGRREAEVPVVLVRDHTMPTDRYEGNDRERVQALRRSEAEFLELVGARVVVGEGIQHHVVPHLGLLRPGMVVLANDSHAPTLGAFDVAAFAGQPTTVAAAIHSGLFIARVPETLRVIVSGSLRPGTTARDAAFTLLAVLRDGSPYPRLATGKALEFTGPGLNRLSRTERAILANVAPESVAVTATFAYADRTLPLAGDIHLDLSMVEPVVALSGSAANVVPLNDLPPIPVDKVFVGTCAGGSFEEIAAFAEGLGSGPVVVPTMVTPASREVRERLDVIGTTASLQAAGVEIGDPGCGACFGFGPHRLADGETAVTTGNRNGIGRMGAAGARIHLTSGRVAGVVARTGWLRPVQSPAAGEPATLEPRSTSSQRPTIAWPRSGNVLRVRGPVTTDDLTPSSVPGIGTSSDPDPTVGRRLLFHHLEPRCGSMDLTGMVLVADENFGAGSNRASAVRALKEAGIQGVIARSFAPLYAMGARDEGLPLVVMRDERFFRLVESGAVVELHLESGRVVVAGEEFLVPPESALERKIRLAGGLVPLLSQGGRLATGGRPMAAAGP